MTATYELIYRDPLGNRRETITQAKLHRAEWVREENRVGVLEIETPVIMAESMYDVDWIIEIWRTIGAKRYLEGETFWYLRKWEFDTRKDGTDFVYMKLYDTNYLLDGRIVWYAADTSESKKSDALDDMMKEIVDENMGSGAVAARDISTYLSIIPDATAAPVAEKAFAWRKMLPILQDLAEKSLEDGTYLVFDTVRTNPAVCEFRTYIDQRGVDHGSGSDSKIIFSLKRHNLAKASLTYDYDRIANAVAAGGQGQSEARTIATAEDTDSIAKSPVARREAFINASRSDDVNYIQSEADSLLQNSRARIIFEGLAQDTRAFRYGVDYNYGDLVVGQRGDISVDCHVDRVHITIQDGKEKLDIRLRGEILL
jgi:hypothetical protein